MKTRTRTVLLSTGLIALALLTVAFSQDAKKFIEIAVQGHVARTPKIEFQDSLLSQLQMPAGFEINVFAKNLGKPRMMAVNSDGTVFVTRPSSNDVIALEDNDEDGVAEESTPVASNLKMVHGIDIRDNKLYLCGVKELFVSDLAGGKPSEPRPIIRDLPDGGQHPNRTIGFDKAGMLYISIGSTCNNCEEDVPEHAAMLRVKPDGSSRTIYARGLRNTIGFDWHPETSELWGMDHGSDWRGDDEPPEELNRLQEGSDYGWPFCYGEKEIDTLTKDPEGSTKEMHCPKTMPSVLPYQAHSAPIEMIFYKGAQFPQEYQGDAFVAMHGSWNRKPATGYKVVRIRFEEGKPVGFEDFVSGFLSQDRKSHFARPAGLAEWKDGSLLISDDSNGNIYRVTYKK